MNFFHVHFSSLHIYICIDHYTYKSSYLIGYVPNTYFVVVLIQICNFQQYNDKKSIFRTQGGGKDFLIKEEQNLTLAIIRF